MEQYSKDRKLVYYPIRKDLKKIRLIQVGPYITATFESYDLMWMQVHEMLFIEKGGREQIQDEISAYNPLIPQGSNFTFTMMIEVDDVDRRTKILSNLCGIEGYVSLVFSGEVVRAHNIDESTQTTKDGKTSAVHFLKFELNRTQREKFNNLNENDVVLFKVDHENYRQSAGLSWELINKLKEDLDS